MNVNDLLDLFLLRYTNKFTARNYRAILTPFAKDHTGEDITSITERDLLEWDQRNRTRGLAPSSLAGHHLVMRVFFNWLVEREYLTTSPARELPITYRRDPRSRAIPSEVLVAMFEHLTHKPQLIMLRDTALLAVMTALGARRGDAHRMRVADVDLVNQRVHMIVKGGKHHSLPIPPQTAAALDAWMTYRTKLPITPEHDCLFVVNRATYPAYQPLALESVNSIIMRLSERVCGKAYGPHSIRHWRGQSLADSGVPATVIQQVLGHSNVKTTLTYYFNQDDPRVQQALAAHELPGAAKPAPTTDVKFWRRSG